METVVIPDVVAERRERVRSFMEEHVYPNESALMTEDERADALIAELQQEAKGAGLWAPHLPPEAGGSGFIEYAYLNEEIGRSFIAQLIFGCQAPDAGNGEILHMFGTPAQKEEFLTPLVAGETRSFFGMTEPENARTRSSARWVGRRWPASRRSRTGSPSRPPRSRPAV